MLFGAFAFVDSPMWIVSVQNQKWGKILCHPSSITSTSTSTTTCVHVQYWVRTGKDEGLHPTKIGTVQLSLRSGPAKMFLKRLFSHDKSHLVRSANSSRLRRAIITEKMSFGHERTV